MRRFLLSFTMLCVALMMHAQFQVQGIPRDAKSPAFAAANAVVAADYDTPPTGDSAADGSFTFDMIQNWSGEGENQAALVLQFNDDREEYALVFGYRFDGESTGREMVETIVKNNPRLYWLTQSGTAYGSVFAAMGWDEDNDGEIALMKSGVTYTPDNEWGIFYTNGYDFDSWSSADEDDFWGSGWNSSYWSYWVKSSATASFSYASFGISSRKITNGCWDGWNFAKGMSAKPWKTFKAAPGLAVPIFKKDGVYYKLTNEKKALVTITAPTELEGETLTSYTGSVTIPATVVYNDKTYTVNVIDNEAFANSDATSISLPSGIEKVGNGAFKNSAFTEIVLPNTITSIGANAFEGCNATNITIPTDLQKVGNEAFKNTRLTSVVLPASVSSIGTGLFQGSSNLVNAPLPEAITEVPANTYDGTAITSANLEGYTSVGENAFRGTKITSVSIPNSVLTIGDNAFNTSTLTSVSTLRLSPLAISENVFSDETYANGTLTVADGYTDTYKAATGWGNFQTVQTQFIATAVGDKFPSNGASFIITKNASDTEHGEVKVTYFAVDTYTATNVKNANKAGYVGDVVIAPTVTFQGKTFDVVSVGDSAFIGATALTSVSLPTSINGIGKHMADGCTALTALDLSAVTAASIPEYAFYGCQQLKEITFPAGIISIDKDAYYNCKAAGNFVIPATVTKIDNYAFNNLASITTVTVPSTVTSVGTYVFANCTKLTSAVVESVMGESMFRANSSLANVTLSDNITTIPSYAFYNCKVLENINMPASLTTINASAFYGCAKFNSPLPASVKTLGNSAFYGCSSITYDNIDNVTSLGTRVFQNCTSITSFRLPESLTSLPNNTFSGCSKLASVDLKNITSIGSYAFDGCSVVSGINFDEIKSISNYAFRNCKKLTSVDLSKLTSLSTYAFYGCTGLTGQIVLSSTLTSLPSNVFYGCTGITSVVLSPKTTSIAYNSVSGCTKLEKVYIPKTSVLSFTATYLRVSTSKYPTLVVPCTLAADYKAKYTSYPVEGIAPESVTVSGSVDTEGTNDTYVAAQIKSYAYAADVPAAMQTAVSEIFVPTAATVEYRKAGSAAEFVAVDATFKNNKVNAVISNLDGDAAYEFRVNLLTADGTAVTSNTFKYATPVFLSANGVYVLNEGWYGHENAHMSFYDGATWIHNVIETVNGDAVQLGCTGAFATIYGGKIYITSKQAQDPSADVTGARLTVLDAATLQVLHRKETLENEADARGILATPQYLYVGTTGGILVYDINTYNYLYTIGNGDVTDLYNGQFGTMLRVEDRVFAVHQSEGIYVLNAGDNQVEATITDANGYGFGSIVMSKDGNLWASLYDPNTSVGSNVYYMLKINPYTLETERVAIEHSIQNSWYAWTADGFFSSNTANKLYWKDDSGYSPSHRIYCYDIDTQTETELINLDDDDYEFYHAAARCNPVTGKIHAPMQENYFGTYGPDVKYRVFDADGQLETEESWNSSYPFPSFVLFPDAYAPEITMSRTLTVKDKVTLSYEDIFNDPDNYTRAALVSAYKISDGISVSFDSGKMTVTAQKEGTFTIEVNSNGKYATAVITVKGQKDSKVLDSDTEQELATGNELALSGFGYTAADVAAAISSASQASIDIIDLTAASLASDATLADIKAAATGSNVSANVLIYAPAGMEASDAVANVVYGNTCPVLSLTDKAAFTPATAFTATKASYAKTGLDGSGWYSAVLPYSFDIPEGVTVLSDATIDGTTISFTELTGTVPANTPFIYKMAANAIAFSNTDVEINAAPVASGALLGTYKRIGVGEATGKLILNSTGDAFATATDKASIPPFRAYIDAPAVGSNTYTIVIDSDPTGINVFDNFTISQSDDCIYDLQGRKVETPKKGQLYIVNGKVIRY